MFSQKISAWFIATFLQSFIQRSPFHRGFSWFILSKIANNCSPFWFSPLVFQNYFFLFSTCLKYIYLLIFLVYCLCPPLEIYSKKTSCLIACDYQCIPSPYKKKKMSTTKWINNVLTQKMNISLTILFFYNGFRLYAKSCIMLPIVQFWGHLVLQALALKIWIKVKEN